MLTIAIPTYNREEPLRRTLQALVAQDCDELSEILVIDNHSDYDVAGLIAGFACEKIRLHQSRCNVGMAMNLVMPFYLAKAEWVWCLSDDDLPCEDAVAKVLYNIVRSGPNVGMIKFSRKGHQQTSSIIEDLPSLIRHYEENAPHINGGDLLFFSTNVVNTKRLGLFIESAFEYNFTHIGYLCPIIESLDKGACHLEMSSNEIVFYCAPTVFWSYHRVGRGLATFSLLPLSISSADRRVLYRLIMQVKPHMLLRTEYVKKQSIGLGEMLYYFFAIYRYTLNPISSVIYFGAVVLFYPRWIRKSVAYLYKCWVP